jgi:hypothetical protein
VVQTNNGDQLQLDGTDLCLDIAISMTTHLLETGSVDRKFNEELSRASVAAFDEYISIHR